MLLIGLVSDDEATSRHVINMLHGVTAISPIGASPDAYLTRVKIICSDIGYTNKSGQDLMFS